MNLYEITNDFLALQQMMEDPDADAEIIADTLEAVEGELEWKAENYAKVIKNLEGNITAISAEVDRLQTKKKTCEAGIKRLKEHLQNAMTVTGKTKFKTDLFSFAIQKNGGALPVIVDVEAWQLPDECVIVKEEPDKKALLQLLQDPEKKDEYSKYAHLGDRGESLRIK